MNYSASTCERLASELEQADRDLPVAKWEVATSNSFRRINGPDGRDGGVLHAVVQRDGQPDLSMNEENLRRLSWLRNSAPEVAAALRSAVARVAELEADRANFGEVLAKTNAALNRAGCFSALYFWEHIDAVAAERNSLRTRVAALEALVEEACDLATTTEYTPDLYARISAIRAAKEAK